MVLGRTPDTRASRGRGRAGREPDDSARDKRAMCRKAGGHLHLTASTDPRVSVRAVKAIHAGPQGPAPAPSPRLRAPELPVLRVAISVVRKDGERLAKGEGTFGVA